MRFLRAVSLRSALPGHLLNLNDDKLRRIERREADEDVDDAQINAGLWIVFPVALDEVSLLRRGSLERALQKELLHERAHVEPDLAPEWLGVGLEDHPLGAVVEAGFDVKREPADG